MEDGAVSYRQGNDRYTRPFFVLIPSATPGTLNNRIRRCKFRVQLFTGDVQAHLNRLCSDNNETGDTLSATLFCAVFLELLPNRCFLLFSMLLNKPRMEKLYLRLSLMQGICLYLSAKSVVQVYSSLYLVTDRNGTSTMLCKDSLSAQRAHHRP